MRNLRTIDNVDSSLSLRPERAGDEAFLERLFNDVRMDAFESLDPALRETLLRQQFAAQNAAYRNAGHPIRFDIVEREGLAVGRVAIAHDGAAIRIVDLAVLTDWRRRGVGGWVLGRAIAEAADAGLPARLVVRTDNVTALRLYLNAGFSVVGVSALDSAMEWRPDATL